MTPLRRFYVSVAYNRRSLVGKIGWWSGPTPWGCPWGCPRGVVGPNRVFKSSDENQEEKKKKKKLLLNF